MRNLSDTITRLSALRSASMAAEHVPGAGRLAELTGFGSNPGGLRAWTHVPEALLSGAPLVVVLHGCTQTAAGYDHGSGWSQLADELGFALLLPEQQRANNPNLCFNWFQPEDSGRDRGEPLSIRQMIAKLVTDHGLDPARIFVTGLSAGGAMTSVMLAAYPELFAGGAIIAGLPYATASGVPEAFDRMRGHGSPDIEELAARVRRASPHEGPWPILSVWQGTADSTVVPSNAEAVIGQWRILHGLEKTPSLVETVDGYPRRIWRDAAGREVIEAYSITGMGHGTPLATTGSAPCGASGSFMLEANISSTRRIAAFWGLAGAARTDAQPGPSAQPARGEQASAPQPSLTTQVGKVIEDALRAAGLMR